MTKKYKFARHVFEINSVYEYFHSFAKEYQTQQEAEYKINITDEMILSWIKEHNVDINIFPMNYIETLVIHSKIADILSKRDTFIFHGSSIYVDNKDNAYIFTAKSGTGKSTHVRLLKENYPDSIFYINDDKPFLSLEDNNFYVYGSPFDGKDRLSNDVKCKLKGIFLLSRSSINKVTRVKGSDVINLITEQTNIPKDIKGKEKAFNFIFELCRNIPCYNLKVTMNKNAAKTSYSVMMGEIK